MIRIGNQCFDDFNEALESIDPAHSGMIQIGIDGEVKGQHIIDRPGLLIQGGCFTNDFGAFELLPDGEKRGTFRSYTLYVAADHVYFDGCEIRNTAGCEHGQAVALMIDGDDIRLDSCSLSSWQDTLFIGPLPEKEYEAGGFKGPMEDRPRTVKHAFFRHCRIEGSVDFIFGSGVGYFCDCEIRSLKPGCVMAPSTVPGQRYGFIMDGCDFVSDITEASVWLARPWRPQGKTLLLNCRFGSHITAQGYTDWGRDMSEVEFREYNNSRKSTDYVREADQTDLAEAEKYRKLISPEAAEL